MRKTALRETRLTFAEHGEQATSDELYNVCIAAKDGAAEWAEWHDDHGYAVIPGEAETTVLLFDSDRTLEAYHVGPDEWAEYLPAITA